MKKIIAMISALALCATVLTACGSASENTETTTETTTAASEAVEESETEASESETAAEGETEAETEGEAETEAPAEDTAANPLQPLADAATAAGEWPVLEQMTDPTMITDFFTLDPENANYRNLLVLKCPMSAVMTEIIIIEADDVDAAVADLNARRDKAIAQDAFYPNDVELAEASIVGSEGNYAYFILAGAAAEGETALIEAIKAL